MHREMRILMKTKKYLVPSILVLTLFQGNTSNAETTNDKVGTINKSYLANTNTILECFKISLNNPNDKSCNLNKSSLTFTMNKENYIGSGKVTYIPNPTVPNLPTYILSSFTLESPQFGKQICTFSDNVCKPIQEVIGVNPEFQKCLATQHIEENTGAENRKNYENASEKCASYVKNIETVKLANQAIDMGGSQIIKNSTANAQSNTNASLTDQYKANANIANQAAGLQSTKAMTNFASALLMDKKRKQISAQANNLKNSILKEEGLCTAGDTTCNPKLIKDLKNALLENNAAAESLKSASISALTQGATSSLSAQEQFKNAKLINNAANSLASTAGTGTTIAAPTPGVRTLGDGVVTTSNVDTFTKTTPESNTGDSGTGTGGGGLPTGAVADSGKDFVAPKATDAEPSGSPASAGKSGGGGGGGGGGANAGNSIAGAGDDGSGKSPQLAGNFGGSDKYESAGKPRSGGSGSSATGTKEDGVDFNSMLAKFLPKDEKPSEETKGEGIQALVNRGPASADEEQLLDQNVDLFQRIAKTYSDKAGRSEVSAE